MSAIIISVMALIFSSSSRRCGNVCKRSRGGAVGNAVGMCVNGQGAELWETVFAVCGKAGSFSIGP